MPRPRSTADQLAALDAQRTKGQARLQDAYRKQAALARKRTALLKAQHQARYQAWGQVLDALGFQDLDAVALQQVLDIAVNVWKEHQG